MKAWINITIVVLALLLLVGAYSAGRQSVTCPVPEPSDSLMVEAARIRAELDMATAETLRLRSLLDSADAAPKPTIKSRIDDAQSLRSGDPLRALIERLDAAPDSL